MERALKVLKRYFGYSSFREGQYVIIENILKGRDVFGVLPTGGGKSICYQVPAVLMQGVTIVISPLISLMKDQVDSINSIGIPAAYINSTLKMDAIREIIDGGVIGRYKLIYIAPERLESEYCVRLLKTLDIAQVAIDEAHCVSQWGHDFRPSYRFIFSFVESLKRRPVVTAFTATATQQVRGDSVALLGLTNPFTYLGGFNRDNLLINIHKEVDKLEFIKDFLRDNPEQSGIIYCATRKEVDSLYEYLRERGFSIGKYHGGLRDQEKEKFQDDFLFERFYVMVATNAFGMGIDKSNVRFIIHFSIPKNLESYYQEIGRGGRDGENCWCHLLYSREDIPRQEYIINTSSSISRREIEIRKLQAIVDFCETKRCYRNFILSYFGDNDARDYCNNCSNCLSNDELRDITIEAQKILSCVYRTRERFGISVLIDILRGYSGAKIIENKLNELSTYGIMKDYSSRFIKDIISSMIEEGYVNLKQGTYSMLKLNEKSIKILKGKEKAILRLKNSAIEVVEDEILFKKLRILRKNMAEKDGVKPYIIFSDASLIEIANFKPRSREELLSIRGVGEKKLQRYGEFILNLINDHVTR
ncbi:ATP-dependent DNA helicase RecQ [Clostridium polyendosporum]|uniref:DNA helicase RecQ n=1 Tax=Clostridium polyendosporum TaxID=69208 RepID=A0A919S073_9CLOT|nr:DNA helicase RecQ [Clostridium polyendosporum]GIM29422.1 ATP-dependent DNA helicase RecQ [Clostridium polyendosporum]